MHIVIDYFVKGRPVPKQSFRYGGKHGYQPEALVNWQRNVYYTSRERCPIKLPKGTHCKVWLDFFMPRDTSDCDNLAKAVLDGMAGVAYDNDKQVTELFVTKRVIRGDQKAGVRIQVMETK